MTERRCPANILALFDGDETSKREGRARAIAWAKTQFPDMQVGDVIFMPDPNTGELMSLTKSSNWKA